MRVVFTNLHCNNLIARPLSFFFVNRPCTYKHLYLLKYLLKNKIKVAVYLDGKMSSFQYKFIKFILPQKVEFFLWAVFNGFNPLKFELITDVKQTKETDVLFVYLFNAVEESFYNFFRGLRVCHISHYMHGIKHLSNAWKKRKIDIFLGENNLKENSPFFNKYFEWFDGDFYVLPHIPQKRFKKSIDFEKRLNKAVATGTTFKYIDNDFNDFFKVRYYHPMRQEIYEKKDELKDLIDCYIENYFENRPLKENTEYDSYFTKLCKKVYNSYYVGKQSKYHKLNFPNLYNQYKLAIIGEEVNNLPGIGFVESMACGCVYIGLNDPMYLDLGMVPNHHYITYNGTLDDLKEQITYYLINENKLNEISLNSYEFVKENFNEDKVCTLLFDYLKIQMENKLMQNSIINKFDYIFTHMTNDEKIKLYELAKSLSIGANIVEIGSYLGASACCIASGLNKYSKLYCIDSWNNDAMSEGTKDTFDEFLVNTKKFEHLITPIRGMSYDVVDDIKKLTNNHIDMFFIDGDHSYEGVKKDWDLYSPLLKSGSIVVFHDIGWADGVKKVVREDVRPLVSKDSNFELPNMYWAWIK